MPVAFRAIKTSGATGTGDIPTWTTVQRDDVSAFSASTGVYTVKVPGDYQVSSNFDGTSTSNPTIQIYKNGVAYSYPGSTGG